MTDQQHPITPPQDKVYKWWEEACERPSSFYEKLDYVAVRAAACGWQQRDASVPGELQEARDEELQACCELLEAYVAYAECGDILRAARRPKPKNLAEQSLEELETLHSDLYAHGFGFDFPATRRALERLQELEGQGND
jgi:hypothetical protein